MVNHAQRQSKTPGESDSTGFSITAYPNGGGSTMEIPIMAYSEFHAMQLAQADYPTWYAVAAYPS